jgi:signal transduction histidine kinase
MKLGHASLNRRLLVGAAVLISLALVVAAIVIDFVLHRFVQGQIDQRLDTQIVFLSSMLTAGDDGVIAIMGNADGPPFDRRARGWYWEVVGPRNVLRSRSLEGSSINAPEFRRPAKKKGPSPADGAGPGNEALHFRIQQAGIGLTPVTIIASAPRSAVNGPLREAMTTLAISLAVLGLALVLAIVLQVRLGLRPLERLRQAVVDVRSGRSRSVPPEQPLEILPLVSELNGLLEQNAANLERARRHVANLAHGLKTPLATLAIALSERGHETTSGVHSLIGLMERRIRHHLGRARAAALSGPTRAQTPIAQRIDDVVEVLRKMYADKRIAFAQDIAHDLAVACEQQDFDEMAGNLLENAFRWARGRVEVHAHRDDGRSVAIVIEDDGPGLRPDQIPQVLRPGERLDESAPGFGFGLPITRELAELYGGELNLDASPLGGLRVTLRLPLAAQAIAEK